MTDSTKSPKDDPLTIDTMPTKELFIDMLTRDISLAPAIIDIADNCADGARRIQGDGSFKGFWARIEISPTEFRISDNCGGIPIDIARKYAFRFGRPLGAPSVKHSIGQFGVGMKRAVFKIGRKFRVESSTATSRFVVEVDVDKWANDKKWEFEFASLEENVVVSKEKQGTVIEIQKLKGDVADTFRLASFETELKDALQSRLQDAIAKGLAVTLNQVPVNAEPLQMLASPKLAPAFKKLDFRTAGSKPVVVKLYCGLGESEDRSSSGWHVFCNGRLILEGDKTEVTGWGSKESGTTIPTFHGQFNHVRGYAYFDSDDAGRLPWNTTKTGVNTDSAIYRATRLEMMKLMRPVVDFCNKLKEEKEQREQDSEEVGPLEELLSKSTIKPLSSISTRGVFDVPIMKRSPAKLGPKLQRIQYDKPVSQVKQVKKFLGAKTLKEVGEKTFDYFYNAEVEE